jgi:CBS domain-containing protein
MRCTLRAGDDGSSHQGDVMPSTRDTQQCSVLDRTTVGEAMHVGVISCALEAPLTQVARLMAEHRIHCVVGFGDVTEDDTRLWGVITDADVMAIAAGADPDDYTAGAAAATEVVMVHADEPLRRAAELMREHQVSHVLVAAEVGDRPIGVISGLDVAKIIGGGRSTAATPGSRVEELMSAPVVTVQPDAPLREVAALLVEHGVSGVPVIQDGEVVGVVSEADIVAKEQASGAPRSSGGRRPRRSRRSAMARLRRATTAGEAMTSPAITIAGWRPASAAAALMVEHGVKRLPVVKDGRLIGLITRADLVRAFARSDAELESEIRNLLHRAIWIEPGSVTASVYDGRATLSGVVESALDAELLVRGVERVPGIVLVDDRLTPRRG